MLRSVALLALTSVVMTGCAHAVVPTSRPATTLAAKSASDFQDLNGHAVSLDEFHGQPIVLVFVDPQSHDSGAEVPNLIRLSDAYPQVAFVAAGENASAKELAAFASENDLRFPVWNDPAGLELAHRHFSRVPAHQFFDRQGKLAYAKQGFMSRGEFLEQLEKLTK